MPQSTPARLGSWTPHHRVMTTSDSAPKCLSAAKSVQLWQLPNICLTSSDSSLLLAAELSISPVLGSTPAEEPVKTDADCVLYDLADIVGCKDGDVNTLGSGGTGELPRKDWVR